MEYKYKDIHKDMFIDRHKWPDVVKDCKVFPNKIEELKLYMVEFDKNDAMKPKVYPSNCTVGGNYWQSIIVITHNKYTFSVNNKIWKA